MTVAVQAGTLPVRTHATVVAAVASAAAGLLHLVAAPGHLASTPTAGVFFLVVGAAQLALVAVLLVEQPSVRVLTGVVLAHLLLVALYVASRTVDLPFAPLHAAGGHVVADEVAAAAPGGIGNGVPVYPGSRTEPVGPLDLACVMAEVVLVAALALALPRRARTVVLDAALVLGAGLAVLRLTA